jgi:hypothetical protein
MPSPPLDGAGVLMPKAVPELDPPGGGGSENEPVEVPMAGLCWLFSDMLVMEEAMPDAPDG